MATDQLTLAHDAFRDLIIAAEAAGWDVTENKPILDRAREGFAALIDVHAWEVAADDEQEMFGRFTLGEDGEQICSNPKGHKFTCTGTAYGGADERWHGEGRCLCEYCGADGDA